AGANAGGDEPQLVQWQSEALACRSGMDVRQLARGVMRQPVGTAVEIRQHGPAFERCGCGATIGEAATDDDAGFRESTRNIATGPWKSEGNIARHRVVNARCTLLNGRLLVGYAR